MLESLAMRVLAVLAALLAVMALVLAFDSSQVSSRRALAFVAFAGLLASLAVLAWRRPSHRLERDRRRLLRLLAVLSDPELQLDYSESTPSVTLAAALRSDWQRATREDLLSSGFPGPEERSALDAVTHALRALPQSSEDLPPLVLRGDPAWNRVESAAREARAMLGRG